MAKKLRPNLNANEENDILPYFWTLASVDEDERLTSAEKILAVVSRLQKQYQQQGLVQVLDSTVFNQPLGYK